MKIKISNFKLFFYFVWATLGFAFLCNTYYELNNNRITTGVLSFFIALFWLILIGIVDKLTKDHLSNSDIEI